jgi:transcriptional regulator with PAS, ATPase and Fis domain
MTTPGFASQVIDSFPHGIIAIDADGVVREINAVAVALNGLGALMPLGLPIREVADISELDWGDLYDAIQQEKIYDDILVSPRGKRILTTARRIKNSERGKQGMLIILYDLELLQHTQRMASNAGEPAGFQNFSTQKVRPDFAHQRILSPELDKLLARGERAILQGARILITGDSGVGKTELARYLHKFVADPTDPFIVVNCASIPETLFESELFGYERGAFTGALQSGKAGFIEKANGGTLFLDEIGEIPPASQGKLLHFLEEGLVQKVGAANPKKVNVRVIAATNQDLQEMVAQRTFRKDLFYRLAVIKLHLRPLRDSIELLDHLIDQCVLKVNQRRSKAFNIPKPCRQQLYNYHFPGNIRELYNIIQQLSIFVDEPGDLASLIPELLMPEADASQVNGEAVIPINTSLKEAVRDYERKIIDATITKLGSKRKAADYLGVDIGTIVRKTKS